MRSGLASCSDFLRFSPYKSRYVRSIPNNVAFSLAFPPATVEGVARRSLSAFLVKEMTLFGSGKPSSSSGISCFSLEKKRFLSYSESEWWRKENAVPLTPCQWLTNCLT
jgi:hypothetical protein